MTKDIPIIEVADISKKYKNQLVLAVKNLTINHGECIALIGNNGAGKTTLLKSIVDLISIDKGVIFFEGKNVAETEQWKDKTSIFFESNLLIPFLTPEEYMAFVAEIKNIEKEVLNSFIADHKSFYKNELFNSSNKYIKELSQGNKQKIGLMSSLIGNKPLIILDEPYSSLDVSSKKYLSKMIKDINTNHNSTFIVSSHNLDDVLNIATRVIILKNGVVSLDTSINKIDKEEIESILEKE